MIKRLVLSFIFLAINAILIGHVYAWNLHINNSTGHSLKLVCTGECKYIHGLTPTIAKENSFNVDIRGPSQPDRAFKLFIIDNITPPPAGEDINECVYNGSIEYGKFVVNKEYCRGGLTGNDRDDTTRPDSYAHIDIALKP